MLGKASLHFYGRWLLTENAGVYIAILLDVISQVLIFHEVRPGAALLVGPMLITLPYVLARH